MSIKHFLHFIISASCILIQRNQSRQPRPIQPLHQSVIKQEINPYARPSRNIRSKQGNQYHPLFTRCNLARIAVHLWSSALNYAMPGVRPSFIVGWLGAACKLLPADSAQNRKRQVYCVSYTGNTPCTASILVWHACVVEHTVLEYVEDRIPPDITPLHRGRPQCILSSLFSITPNVYRISDSRVITNLSSVPSVKRGWLFDAWLTPGDLFGMRNRWRTLVSILRVPCCGGEGHIASGGASVAPPWYTLNVNIEMPVVGWRLPARRSGSTRSGATWLHLATDARRSSRVSVLLWVIFEPSVVWEFPVIGRKFNQWRDLSGVFESLAVSGEGWFRMFACVWGVWLLAFMRITTVIEIVIAVIIFVRKFGLNLGRWNSGFF